eukprot:TRINITY_DN6187_c0_g1_i6.p1 TRINITY_DN6187_c0_g1~~TRINITY_DN6187_c0_g1_i6.p1  ORF type:complete len:1618 (-),score=325.27 TRINITY_DN6187_c0_g1_i6:88-4554(-)
MAGVGKAGLGVTLPRGGGGRGKGVLVPPPTGPAMPIPAVLPRGAARPPRFPPPEALIRGPIAGTPAASWQDGAEGGGSACTPRPTSTGKGAGCGVRLPPPPPPATLPTATSSGTSVSGSSPQPPLGANLGMRRQPVSLPLPSPAASAAVLTSALGTGVSQLVQALLPRAALAASHLPTRGDGAPTRPSSQESLLPGGARNGAAAIAAVLAATRSAPAGESSGAKAVQVKPPQGKAPPSGAVAAQGEKNGETPAKPGDDEQSADGKGSTLPPNLFMDQSGLVREISGCSPGTAVVVHTAVQPPPPPAGIPVGFRDQIRLQVSQVENTSGKPCRFRRGCKKLDCVDEHPEGRDIVDDPESLVCRFGRKCKRGDCFYLHPAGRELDEDPSRGQCNLGKACTKPECIFSHPEGRAPVIQVRCHACGEAGHIQKDCPHGKQERRCRVCNQVGHFQRDCPLGAGARSRSSVGTFVSITGFPEDWVSQGEDRLIASIASELEAFGTLSSAPEISENATKAVAAFADAESAREAVQALNGAAFQIELCVSPSTVLALIGPDEFGGSVDISGFPLRWGVADLAAFLRGALKKNNSQHIAITTEERATLGKGTVKFPDVQEARKACAELKGQKVAGRPLSLLLDGSEVGDEDGSKADGDLQLERRARSRSRGGRKEDEKGTEGGGERRGSGRHGPHLCATIHLDAILMPRRPQVEPSPNDCEVFVDPLPDEENLEEFLEAFGQTDDVYRIPHPTTNEPSDRGYVRFKEHEAATRCVKSGSGSWSESERALSSQRTKHGGRDSAYPDSLIARILGPRGEMINQLKLDVGASHLMIRGDGLSDNEKMTSQRVHFVCRGPQETIDRLDAALEKLIEEVHEGVRAKIANTQAQPRKRSNSRPRMVLDRTRSGGGRRARDREDNPDKRASEPWKPPGSGGGENGPHAPPPAPGPHGGDPWRPGMPNGWPHNGWMPPPGMEGHWRGPPPPGPPMPGYGAPMPWGNPASPWAAAPHPWMAPGQQPPPPPLGSGGSSTPGHWEASQQGLPPGSWRGGEHGSSGAPPGNDAGKGGPSAPAAAPTAGGEGATGPATGIADAENRPAPGAGMPAPGSPLAIADAGGGATAPAAAEPAPVRSHRGDRNRGDRDRGDRADRGERRHRERRRASAGSSGPPAGATSSVAATNAGSSPPAQASASASGSAPAPSSSPFEGVNPAAFLLSLPSRLTGPEVELADAVVNFLRTWASNHDLGRHPNLVHLGADVKIRKCKANALPPEVALRSWIEQRFAHQVLMVRDASGKTTVQLAAPDEDDPMNDAAGSAREDLPKPSQVSSRPPVVDAGSHVSGAGNVGVGVVASACGGTSSRGRGSDRGEGRMTGITLRSRSRSRRRRRRRERGPEEQLGSTSRLQPGAEVPVEASASITEDAGALPPLSRVAVAATASDASSAKPSQTEGSVVASSAAPPRPTEALMVSAKQMDIAAASAIAPSRHAAATAVAPSSAPGHC